jgi:hypothetical protein
VSTAAGFTTFGAGFLVCAKDTDTGRSNAKKIVFINYILDECFKTPGANIA